MSGFLFEGGEAGVGFHVADDFVFGEKDECPLGGPGVFQQVFEFGVAVLAQGACPGAGGFQRRGAVAGQKPVAQAHEQAHGGGLAPFGELRGPAAGLRPAVPRGPAHPVGEGLLDAFGHPGAAERFGKTAFFELWMDGDLTVVFVEDAHHASVAAHPDFAADVFGGHFVAGALEADVSVALHFARGFLEAGEDRRGQGAQGWFFDFGEMGADLLARGAVDAPVGDVFFPMAQVGVERGERIEPAAFHGVLLQIVHVAFHLALVLRGAREGGHGRGLIVPAEGRELRVELRIVEVGLEHAGLQVVEHEQFGHAAEVPEGVFNGAHEAFGVLARHGFGVALARMAQHHPEHVDFAPLAADAHPEGCVVDLRLLAGEDFHAPDALRVLRLELAHEALDRFVGVGEAVLPDQILPDALGMEAFLQFGLDDLAVGFAVAGASGPARAAFPVRIMLRAGGRNGTL